MKDYTVYVVKEKGTGRYFRKRSVVHGLRIVDWTYHSDRAFKVDRRVEAELVVDQLTADGYDVDIYVHSKGAQPHRHVSRGIFARRTAWNLALLISIAGTFSCGLAKNQDALSAERISILGEPVDEGAVLDAVATVMGESETSNCSIDFMLGDIFSDAREVVGFIHSCNDPEEILVHLSSPDQCIFDTSLVHELVHLWDKRVRGTPCGELEHPVEFFGRCGDGGLVGEINDYLREKHCPGSPKPPMRVCAVDG